jgi:hypothetical protein
MIAPANYYEACEDMKAFITKRRDYLKEMRVKSPKNSKQFEL